MNYWMLQCNPNKWQWFEAVRNYEKDTWGVSLYANKIDLGDIAFIWLANLYERNKVIKSRGIYATGEVTGLPDENRKRFDWEYKYWINRKEMERLSQLPRLELKYINTFVSAPSLPLLVDGLKEANLGHLLVLRMPQRGIYKLTHQDGVAIKYLVENR